VGECCDGHGYQETFGEGFARRASRRYRQRGLSRTQQRLVDFLAERGIEGATVLEIGGGIGEIQVELLRSGAARATNLEISENYEAEAADLLRKTGLAGRVSRRLHDIATEPDEVEPADIVVLHRVVCCYPDYEKLLGNAAGHARRMLVFSHPPRNLVSSALIGLDNQLRRLRGNDFRAFVHPPSAMVDVVSAQGLTLEYRHRGYAWNVVGFAR
jgi:2-polyprenyl-3-methyl-5-hydroxy-6-metoxy-1,4-benzoquinol methylase